MLTTLKPGYRAVTAPALAVLALSFGLASPSAEAADVPGRPEVPFARAKVLIQVNDTDGDLGFHARIDGEAWTLAEIFDPQGRAIFRTRVGGRLGRQGLTELAFESAEPPFEELPPAVFFARFPIGTYDIEGLTLDGEAIEGESVLTHVIPAAPQFVSPPFVPCDAPAVLPDGDVVVAWQPVTTSHPTLGVQGAAVEVANYEVTIERVEPAPVLSAVVALPRDVTEFAIPPAFLALGTGFKVQLLVVEAGGNETSSETCFVIAR